MFLESICFIYLKDTLQHQVLVIAETWKIKAEIIKFSFSSGS